MSWSYETGAWWIFPALFGTGLAAGFVDAIAGGGGLITLPVLLGLGIPPKLALGTNKMQSVFGAASASWSYARAGFVRLRDCRAGIFFTAMGAAAGSFTVQRLDPGFLKIFIPGLLIVLGLYSLFHPRLGLEDVKPQLAPAVFHVTMGLGLGFYDGIFGPGTGLFWAMAYLFGMGFNLTRATAHTKLMNLTSNVVALTVFLSEGNVIFSAALAMGVGQLLGARLGAGLVQRRGARLIRPIFILVVLAISARLLYQNLTES